MTELQELMNQYPQWDDIPFDKQKEIILNASTNEEYFNTAVDQWHEVYEILNFIVSDPVIGMRTSICNIKWNILNALHEMYTAEWEAAQKRYCDVVPVDDHGFVKQLIQSQSSGQDVVVHIHGYIVKDGIRISGLEEIPG